MTYVKPVTKINISKNMINDVYFKELFGSKDRYIVLIGGSGSGKSWAAFQYVLYRLLTEKGHRVLVVRKVARTLRQSVWALTCDLISQWGLSHLFTINKTDFTITCNPNGNQILYVGMDDPEKIKSVAGITLIICEEASELNEFVPDEKNPLAPTTGGNDFTQLDLRLRGKTKHTKQIILMSNPISEANWLKRYFFDREIPNTKIIKTTYKDNKFIDEEYKETLENLQYTNPNMYKVYALGEWGLLKGQVFSNYAIDDDVSMDTSDYKFIVRALDFGFNDPSCWLSVGFNPDKREAFVFEELYQTKLTTDDLIKEVEKLQDKHEILICDSAEPDRIESFKRAGFSNVKGVKKGKNSIRNGIDHMLQYKIYIHPNCVNLIREMQSYRWAETKEGTPLDVPEGGFDHAIDSLRYCFTVVKKRKKIKAGKTFY